MSPADFVKQYEAALATQKWEVVSPLVHESVSVIFSCGSAYRGKPAVQAAYERNFAAINNEDYKISNVYWLLDRPDTAAYMFDFFWTGVVRDHTASGAGRGTALLKLENDQWQLLAEHLGPYPQQ